MNLFKSITLVSVISLFFIKSLVFASTQVSFVYPIEKGVKNAALSLLPIIDISKRDNTLPGIPSKNIKEYKKELVEWSNLAALPLSIDMASKYISTPYSAGLDSSVKMTFSSNGSHGTQTYFDNNKPLWKLMREILFIEQLKKSVSDWNLKYVYGPNDLPKGEGKYFFKEAYNRAVSISDQYNDFVKDIGGKYSPLLSAIIGAGSTSYFTNIYQSDGSLEKYAEGKAILLLENGKSMFNDGFRESMDLNASGAGKFLTTAGIEFIKQNTSSDIGIMIEAAQNVAVTVEGVASGGLSVVLGPVALYHGFIDKLINSSTEQALGAHITLHYLLSQKYPKILFNSANMERGNVNLMNEDGILNVDTYVIKSKVDVKSPPDLIKELTTKRHAYNFPSKDEALSVYSISSLFQLAHSIDIDEMKKNIVAYVVLKAEADKFKNDPKTIKLKHLSEKYKTYALLADKIYGEGYKTVGNKYDPFHPSEWVLKYYDSQSTGFQGGLYEHSTTGEYILAFGGTTASAEEYNKLASAYDSYLDVLFDVTLLSNYSLIFDQTKSLMDFLNHKTINEAISSGKVKGITGHSLGGGLAAYAGLYLDINTITFNAAPLPFTNNDIKPFMLKNAVKTIVDSNNVTIGFEFLNKNSIHQLSTINDPLTGLNQFLISKDRNDKLINKMKALKAIFFVSPTLSIDYILPGKQITIPMNTGHSMAEIYDALRLVKISDNTEAARITISVPSTASFTKQNNVISVVQDDEIIVYLEKQFLRNHPAIQHFLDKPFQIGYKKSGDDTLYLVDSFYDYDLGALKFSSPIIGKLTLVSLNYKQEVNGFTSTETVYFPTKQNFIFTPKLKNNKLEILPSNIARINENILKDITNGYYWQDMPENSNVYKTVSEATSYCTNLSLGGTKWKLPSKNELLSIVDTSLSRGKIKEGFNHTSTGLYWSSDAGKTINESGNTGGISWMGWNKSSVYQWAVSSHNGSAIEKLQKKYYSGFEYPGTWSYYKAKYRCVSTEPIDPITIELLRGNTVKQHVWISADAGGRDMNGHTMAIKQDGTLWGSGNNMYGQLGDGTQENKKVLTQIGNDNDWLKVEAGGGQMACGYTIALKTDGTLWSWGYNEYGQLGRENINYYNPIPTQVGSDNGWRFISAGDSYTMAIKTDGSLWAWGMNYDGQLGDGTKSHRFVPTQIGSDNDWKKVSAGERHTLAIKNDGSLWWWGTMFEGAETEVKLSPTKVGNDTDWIKISAGNDHSIAIKNQGTLWAWGRNNAGQLGDGTTVNTLEPKQLGTDSDWALIDAQDRNTMAIKTDGSLWAWGEYVTDYMGTGSKTKIPTPTQIGEDTHWKLISLGTWHTIALKDNNTLWGWGNNDDGQIAYEVDLLEKPITIGFISENYPDNTIVKIPFTKEWKFSKSLVDLNLTISVLENTYSNRISESDFIMDGNILRIDLTPNTEKVINKLIVQFKDVNDNIVKIGPCETFWSQTKTNHLPTLANGQQTQIIRKSNELSSLLINTYDADEDNVSLSVVDADGGKASFSGKKLNVTYSDQLAVHTVKIKLNDGKEEVIKDISVLQFVNNSIEILFSDLNSSHQYFSDIAFATLKGVVTGQSDRNNNLQRVYRPDENASWAEALAMVLKATSISGKISLPNSDTYLKAFPKWVMPYYSFAREQDAITFQQHDLSTIYPTREAIAMLLVKSLSLEEKLAQIPELPFDFVDNDQFSSSLMRRYGQIVRFFGLFMTDSQARPGAKVTRGELARVIRNIFMMPSAEINVQTSVEFGETLNIDFISNIKALDINQNYELVDSSDSLTVQYSINRKIVDPAKVDVSVFEIGTNKILALLDNHGVRNLINKQIEVTFSDRDFDGVQNNLDKWPDDFRYNADLNDNGIPDVLDNIFGLADKSVDDTITFGQYQTKINEVIKKGRVPCPQVQYVGVDPDTGEKKQFKTLCAVPLNWQAYIFDTIAPTISPSVGQIESTGYLTPIGINMVSVDDNVDTEIIPFPDKNALRPGKQTVTWTALDNAGNKATALQIVDVLPQVNMAIDGIVEEGNMYVLSVMLNGNPSEYPVIVPYFIEHASSTANKADHDLINGELVITKELGLTVTKQININHDDKTEGIEFLDVRLGTPTNAVKGKRDVHRITIVENNIAPDVAIDIKQNGKVVNSVFQDQGLATIICKVQDINATDKHSYNWLQSDNELSAPTDLTTTQWQIDPKQLTVGKFYRVKLGVSDGSCNVYKEILLSVKDQIPILDGIKDTDEDGVTDADEGLSDSDGDGISDYLDKRTLPPEYVEINVGGKATAIETTPGLKIKLGSTAQKMDNPEMLVSINDIAYSNGVQPADILDNYDNVGGLFDFIVSGLPMIGSSIPIVLPQKKAIPENAVYRKYDKKYGWNNFVVTADDKNKVYSAPGELGICPPPEDSSYVAGLRKGNYCVKLIIEDGGPNDTDGLVNGEVMDPGGVFVLKKTPDNDVPSTPIEPDSVKYTITFDTGENGIRIGGGALVQEVEKGGSAIEPDIQALSGYILTGWDNSFSNVQSSKIVTAVYEATTFKINVIGDNGIFNLNDGDTLTLDSAFDKITFMPTGGSSSLAVKTSFHPQGADSPEILSNVDGTIDFKPSLTGAFAGNYQLEFYDPQKHESINVNVKVPMIMEISNRIVLDLSNEVTVNVTGAASGDIIDFTVLDENGIARTDIAAVDTATTINNKSKANIATSVVYPEKVVQIIPFSIMASNMTNKSIGSVTSKSMQVTPSNVRNTFVVDNQGNPVAGVSITSVYLNNGIEQSYKTISAQDGSVSILLPKGQFSMKALHPDFLPFEFTTAQFELEYIVLSRPKKKVDVIFKGFIPDDTAFIKAYYYNESNEFVCTHPVNIASIGTDNGKFLMALESRRYEYFCIVAPGYEPIIYNNEGAGYDPCDLEGLSFTVSMKSEHFYDVIEESEITIFNHSIVDTKTGFFKDHDLSLYDIVAIDDKGDITDIDQRLVVDGNLQVDTSGMNEVVLALREPSERKVVFAMTHHPNSVVVNNAPSGFKLITALAGGSHTFKGARPSDGKILDEVSVSISAGSIDFTGFIGNPPPATLEVNTLSLTGASPSVRAMTSALENLIVEVKIHQGDHNGKIMDFSGRDGHSPLKKVIITIPFDTQLVQDGDFENEDFMIYHSHSRNSFLKGIVGVIPLEDLVDIDYSIGMISFKVSHLSVFSIGNSTAILNSGRGGSKCFISSIFTDSNSLPCISMIMTFWFALIFATVKKKGQ